jgi:hypothetical protein
MAKAKTNGWSDATMIPLDSLVFCPWNVNEMGDEEFSELVAEIEDTGFDEPLQVIPITKQHLDANHYPDISKVAVEGKYLVLGGEHRARAAISLEWKEAPCVIKDTLQESPESDLKIWTVKRNNIRGRINAQRYADLERSLSERYQIRADAARRKMLVKGDLLKKLRKNIAVQDNEGGDGSGGDDDDDDDDDLPPTGRKGPATDSEKDHQNEIKDRRSLLNALKTAEEEVLLQSADTVEHGYVFFAQCASGQTHLVVDETPQLAGLVKRMVAACKNESERIDRFLADAITAELANWEDK